MSLLLAIWLSALAPLAGKVRELLPPLPHLSSLGTQSWDSPWAPSIQGAFFWEGTELDTDTHSPRGHF